MIKNLCEEFKCFDGQPVKIFTDDRRVHMGIVLESGEHSVRIIDRCGRLFLIEYCHIDAVEEPQMRLRQCRKGEGWYDEIDSECGYEG